MATWAELKGDLSGAITAATITMPPCIGYDIIVFAPLGVGFASSGALLGLYTAIFAGSEVLILPFPAFVALLREEPEVALKSMLNIAKVLTTNVRLSSKELLTLADSCPSNHLYESRE